MILDWISFRFDLIYDCAQIENIAIVEVPLIVGIIFEYVDTFLDASLNSAKSKNRKIIDGGRCNLCLCIFSTHIGGYRRQNSKQSSRMAGIHWNKTLQMLCCQRFVLIEPPGYQTTPFIGILLRRIQRPHSINSIHDILISAEVTKW